MLPLLTLFLAGFLSQINQALLVRELLVSFQGHELVLSLFYAFWLAWMAVGGLVGRALPPRLMPRMLLAFSLLSPAGLLLPRFARLLLPPDVGEMLPLDFLLIVSACAALPGGLLLGILFAPACALLPGGEDPIRRTLAPLFAWEAAGALLGGVAAFLAVERIGPWPLVTVSAGWAALLALLPFDANTRMAKWPVWGLALLLFSQAFPPLGGAVEERLEVWRFVSQHPGMTRVTSVETRFGHTALGKLGAQWSLLEDGRVTASFPDAPRARQEAAYFLAQSPGTASVLLFGGLFDGLAFALLDYPLARLDLVLSDETAYRAILPYLPVSIRQRLQDPRLQLHFVDGRRFARESAADGRYDLILSLAGDPASVRQNRFFTREFLERLVPSLAQEGVFCTRVAGGYNYQGRELQGFGASVFHTVRTLLPEIAVAPGEVQTFCASREKGRVTQEADVLERRHGEHPPTGEDRLASGALRLMAAPERAALARQTLEAAPAVLNRDDEPVTFFLNLALWSALTGNDFLIPLQAARRMGAAAVIAPVAWLALLLLMRRLGAGANHRPGGEKGVFLLLTVGWAAMALQLLLLVGHQARLGHLHGQIALLNGLFMAGLALGGGVAGRLPPAALAGVLMLLLGLAFFLPGVLPLANASVFLALSAGTGLLAGAGFPLATRLLPVAPVSFARAGGLASAADNLGGAVGALVFGLLLLPATGYAGVGATVAALCLAGLLVLLPLPTGRTRRLILSPLAFALWWLVLTPWSWSLLDPGREPPPQTTFSQELLARASGSQRFTHADTPFPHDRGEGPVASPATLTLPTRPVAGEVKGFAGPLDLLVSVTEEGRLRGALLLASRETPAYVAGLEAWLAGLAGRDLSGAPLTLEAVDGLAGATITSRAALATIEQAVRRASAALLPRVFPPEPGRELSAGVRPVVILALLWLALVVHGRGSARERTLFLVASLLAFGVWLNALPTEIDLGHLSRGHLPGEWSGWLLLGFALGAGIFLGPVHCGLVCPFGAVQGLAEALGRGLGLARPHPFRVEWLRPTLLALVFAAFWLTGENAWLAVNPMQGFFHWQGEEWLWGLGIGVVGVSLVFPRFWCRLFCPMGGFLGLFNRLALFSRRMPARRFPHCPLAVADAREVGCLRCGLCLPGISAPAGDSKPERASRFLFLFVILATLAGMAGGLYAGLAADEPAGWRRIDLDAVREGMRRGRLSDRQADWWQPAEGEFRP